MSISADDLLKMLAANKAPRAEFAYIDDSGDPGMNGKGSKTFGLGCVLIPLDHWTKRLDYVHAMRKEVNATYRVKLRDEVKGEWLAGVKKHFRELRLGDGQLRDIYRRHLQTLPVVSSGAFAVVVRKELIQRADADVEDIAWQYLMQRLRLRTMETGAPIVIIHDQSSSNAEIRKKVRRARRFLWANGRAVTADLVVEDPVPRQSDQTYFIQLADLVAYACTRKVLPARGRGSAICSDQMWDEAGSARLSKVSPRRGDGIVVWP